MLSVDGLTIRAGTFRLSDVSLTVDRGDYAILLGQSGAGKSLLLEALAGIQPIRGGFIKLAKNDITNLPIHRRNLPLVTQRPRLFPHMTVRRNIGYALRSKETVESLAHRVGADHLLDRMPGSLSGGEAQRVALARALATGAACILLDEPLTALDVTARQELRHVLRALNAEGQTFLHVTHEYEEALALATKLGVIENGRLTQFGTPHEILSDPRSSFVARFVGIRNVFEGELLPPGDGNLREFRADGTSLWVLSDAEAGPGYLLLRSEDVTASLTPVEDSARNHFEGSVRDIVSARLGKEVTVDAGAAITALVSAESCDALKLVPGAAVYVNFKAAAARFVPRETQRT